MNSQTDVWKDDLEMKNYNFSEFAYVFGFASRTKKRNTCVRDFKQSLLRLIAG